MDMLAYFHVKTPDVVHETIDGETVIVNLESGAYYSLRDSAVEVWNTIERGANANELQDVLLSRYEGSQDEIHNALTDLLLHLQEEGLVKVSSKRSAELGPDLSAWSGQKTPFVSPKLEKYSDMQDLLLLDPIHEVDDDGWPNKAEGEVSGDAGGG